MSASCFSQNARLADGLDTICRSCSSKATKEARQRRKNGIEKKRPGTTDSTRLGVLNGLIQSDSLVGNETTMQTEKMSIDLLEDVLDQSFEVRRWQDGTKSDIGIRPFDEDADLWLPLQIKADFNSKITQFSMKSKGGELPMCTTICVALSETKFFVFSPTEIPDLPMSKLRGIVKMRTFKKWERWATAADALPSTLLKLFDDKTLLRTEEQLRMDVGKSNMTEMLNIKYTNMLFPDTVVEWPKSTMTVTDLFRDGEEEQYKSATATSNLFYARHCSKKWLGVHVPYEEGDNKWYVFGVVINDPPVFLNWRIPESFMIEKGMLSRRRDPDNFDRPGKTTMMLHIVGKNGENSNIQQMVFGKMPRSDVDPTTAQFLRVLWL